MISFNVVSALPATWPCGLVALTAKVWTRLIAKSAAAAAAPTAAAA